LSFVSRITLQLVAVLDCNNSLELLSVAVAPFNCVISKSSAIIQLSNLILIISIFFAVILSQKMVLKEVLSLISQAHTTSYKGPQSSLTITVFNGVNIFLDIFYKLSIKILIYLVLLLL